MFLQGLGAPQNSKIIATQAELDQAAKNFVVGKEYVYAEHLDDRPFYRAVSKAKRGQCVGTTSSAIEWIVDPTSDPNSLSMVQVRTFQLKKPSKTQIRECEEAEQDMNFGDSVPDLPFDDKIEYRPLPVETEPAKKVQLPTSDEGKDGIPMWVWYSLGGAALFFAYRHFSK